MAARCRRVLLRWVADSTVHTVSQSLFGLQPGTTYHYRLVAHVGASTADGPDQTFMTTPISATVTTGRVAGVSATGAVVFGTVNPGGVPTSFYVDYGTDTSYGQSAPLTQASVGSDSRTHLVTEELTGLRPDDTYHYRVVAIVGGFTVNGADKTFKTRALTP